MKSFLLITTLLFSWASSAADFSGHWIATDGKVTSNVGLSSACRTIEIKIKQTATSLVTERYRSDCGNNSSDWGPVTEEIRNGKVYEGGEEVGTFDGTTLRTVSQSGSVSYIYDLILSVGADGQPRLQSRYGVSNFVGQIMTEATAMTKTAEPPVF